jgi:hypothetical protein
VFIGCFVDRSRKTSNQFVVGPEGLKPPTRRL